MDDKKDKLEIVEGNSKDLDISEVKDNIVLEDSSKRKNSGSVVIPTEQNSENNKD